MAVAMQMRVDELIDVHGGILQAIANRRHVIERRLAEGKASPRAEAELAVLEGLGLGYRTARDIGRGAPLPPDYL